MFRMKNVVNMVWQRSQLGDEPVGVPAGGVSFEIGLKSIWKQAWLWTKEGNFMKRC